MSRRACFLPPCSSVHAFPAILLAHALLLAGLALTFPATARAYEMSDPLPMGQVDDLAEAAAGSDSELAGPIEDAAGLSERSPVLLRLPSVGVEVEVEAVGAKPDGGMEAPTDPDKAGWYRYGPWPGAPGNAAIAGHVDWAGRARPFWYLRWLQEGDPVEIVSADGESFEFEVQWSRMYDAYDAPLDEIYGGTDLPEVTLITCGGTFDPATRQYLGRLVVRAATPSS